MKYHSAHPGLTQWIRLGEAALFGLNGDDESTGPKSQWQGNDIKGDELNPAVSQKWFDAQFTHLYVHTCEYVQDNARHMLKQM